MKVMENENIVLEGKKHGIIFFIPAILGVMLIFASLVSSGGSNLIGALTMTLIVFAPAIYKKKNNELVVSNIRIYGKTGFIKTKEMSSPINKVQNVEIEVSVLGKMFGYGTICITSVNGTYKFKTMKNANQFRDKLFEIINN